MKVPSDWGVTKRLVWTLTIRGRTEKANAFLLPEWEMGGGVITASFAGIRTASERNQAPNISLGPDQTIALPKTATLTALVSDDGLPLFRQRPPRPAPGAPAARTPAAGTPTAVAATAGVPSAAEPRLGVEWIAWRRPAGATVKFDPAKSPVTGGKGATTAKPEPVINGKAGTTVSFSAPGMYMLKGVAFDGAITTPSAGVTVTVNPAP